MILSDESWEGAHILYAVKDEANLNENLEHFIYRTSHIESVQIV